MKIDILSTGSHGNAILFCESVLLDAGVAYKHLKPYVSSIKAVLLTHIHGDHFNKSVIQQLCVANESIKFCCGEFLVDNLIDLGIPKKSIVTLKLGQRYKIDDISFWAVHLYHDAPNFGYRIHQGKHKHFHATDTATLEGITANNYDTATLECNHEIVAADKIMIDKANDGEFCHLRRAVATHLGVAKAIDFVQVNSIKTLYPVHIGRSTKKEVFDALAESNINIKRGY